MKTEFVCAVNYSLRPLKCGLAIFEVITAVFLRIQVVWYMTLRPVFDVSKDRSAFILRQKLLGRHLDASKRRQALAQQHSDMISKALEFSSTAFEKRVLRNALSHECRISDIAQGSDNFVRRTQSDRSQRSKRDKYHRLVCE